MPPDWVANSIRSLAVCNARSYRLRSVMSWKIPVSLTAFPPSMVTVHVVRTSIRLPWMV